MLDVMINACEAHHGDNVWIRVAAGLCGAKIATSARSRRLRKCAPVRGCHQNLASEVLRAHAVDARPITEILVMDGQ